MQVYIIEPSKADAGHEMVLSYYGGWRYLR